MRGCWCGPGGSTGSITGSPTPALPESSSGRVSNRWIPPIRRSRSTSSAAARCKRGAASLRPPRHPPGRRRRGGGPEPATLPSVAADTWQDSEELGAVLGTELGEAPVDALLYAGDAPLAVVPALASRVRRAAVLVSHRE